VNEHRFAIVTQSLNRLPSRRDLVRGLAGAGFGLAAARLPDSVTARQERRKRKKARPNAFGCFNVGKPCKRAAQCCSSICERKRRRAHDTGTCVAGKHPASCGGASNVACTTSLEKAGFCATTTGNAGYCIASGECFVCSTDAECQAAKNGKYGSRAACVRCAGECTTTGGTACVGPDTVEIPV
jgi:hypothetical protein